MKTLIFRHIRLILPAAIALVAYGVASAHTPTHASHGLPHTEAARDTLIQQALVANSPDEFASPENLVFASPDKKFVLGVGGFLKASASYDFGHPIDNPYSFIVSEIPMSLPKGNGGKFQASAQTSTIYTNFLFNPGKNQVGAFLAIDFSGDNYVPAVQYAFLRYRGFQAGYDETLFTDPASCPPSIDDQGPNAYTGVYTTGLRYSRSWGPNGRWQAGIGLELPQASYTTAEGASSEVSQRVPDIPAFIRYNNPYFYLRLSGVLRNISYRDLRAAQNRISTAWGVSLSANVSIIPDILSFNALATYGHGISSYFQDINGMNLDLLPSDRNAGRLTAVPGWGAFGAFVCNLSDKWHSAISYSHVRIYDRHALAEPDQYRYGQYVLANLFYDINSYLTCGVEYLYGRRVDFSHAQAHDNRLQTMLQFTF